MFCSIGDFVDFFMVFVFIKKVLKVDGGFFKCLYGMMFINIMFDLVIGFIFFIGDIVDVFY